MCDRRRSISRRCLESTTRFSKHQQFAENTTVNAEPVEIAERFLEGLAARASLQRCTEFQLLARQLGRIIHSYLVRPAGAYLRRHADPRSGAHIPGVGAGNKVHLEKARNLGSAAEMGVTATTMRPSAGGVTVYERQPAHVVLSGMT